MFVVEMLRCATLALGMSEVCALSRINIEIMLQRLLGSASPNRLSEQRVVHVQCPVLVLECLSKPMNLMGPVKKTTHTLFWSFAGSPGCGAVHSPFQLPSKFGSLQTWTCTYGWERSGAEATNSGQSTAEDTFTS